MTEEKVDPEVAALAFQQQAADRLVLFRLNQSCIQDIFNYMNQRIAQLEKDMIEVTAAQRSRESKTDE
tara:strand:- start:4472 stop:4675 length:204 start_codon:yes stop_codon:yes gene_type:complete